jgi:acetylglutamate synthase
MRIPPSGPSPTNITFSAPFLDNTLAKLLALQNRMLKVSQEIAASEDVEDGVKHEQFSQAAELSRIIALICAEKARQGA